MLKVVVDYPKKEEEKLIIRMNNAGEFPTAAQVLKPADIRKAREVVREVYMDEKIERYIVDLVFATREPKLQPATAQTDDRIRLFTPGQHIPGHCI